MRAGRGIFDCPGDAGGPWTGLIALLAASLCASAASGQVTLSQVRTFVIQKTSGTIDQALVFSTGEFLVRDYDLRDEENQAIEIYDKGGRFIRKLGKFGEGPGQYFRLTSIAIGDDGAIWAADLAGRLMRYSATGQFLGSTLIQKPSYRVSSLVLDGKHGVFYLVLLC